jgi:hypothetical protein
MSVREQERQARQAERKAQGVLRACDRRLRRAKRKAKQAVCRAEGAKRRIEVGSAQPRPLAGTRTAPRAVDREWGSEVAEKRKTFR